MTLTSVQFLIPNGRQRTRETNLQNGHKNVPIDGFSPPVKSEECRIFLEERGALGNDLECEDGQGQGNAGKGSKQRTGDDTYSVFFSALLHFIDR